MNEQPDSNEKSELTAMDNKPLLAPAFSPVEAAYTKRNGLGISSFILALVSIASFIVLTIMIIIWLSHNVDFRSLTDGNGNLTVTEEELIDLFSPLLSYLVIYPLIFLTLLVGVVIGIVGIVRPGYRKLFAIIGTVLNGISLLMIVLLIILGLFVL